MNKNKFTWCLNILLWFFNESLAFDLDPMSADGHPHSSIITHLFDHLTTLTGLSDHKVLCRHMITLQYALYYWW